MLPGPCSGGSLGSGQGSTPPGKNHKLNSACLLRYLSAVESLPGISEITFKLEPKSQTYSISFFDLHFLSQDAGPILGHCLLILGSIVVSSLGPKLVPKLVPRIKKIWSIFETLVF